MEVSFTEPLKMPHYAKMDLRSFTRATTLPFPSLFLPLLHEIQHQQTSQLLLRSLPGPWKREFPIVRALLIGPEMVS